MQVSLWASVVRASGRLFPRYSLVVERGQQLGDVCQRRLCSTRRGGGGASRGAMHGAGHPLNLPVPGLAAAACVTACGCSIVGGQAAQASPAGAGTRAAHR